MSAEEPNRPLNIILDVRTSVMQAQTNYQAALHGIVSGDLDELRKNWHVQTFAYYREIARYHSETNINDIWNGDDESQIEINGEILTLEGLRTLQFDTERYQVEEYDQINKKTKTVTKQRVKAFEPETLLRITALLDRCVSELGFDAEPSSELETYSYQGDN